MRTFAILIDGGFLKRKLGSRENPLTAESVEKFVERLKDQDALRSFDLHRIYFYDAPPLRSTERKPLAGGNIMFSETRLARDNQRLHKELRGMPFVAPGMGDLRFRGWTLNAHRLPADQPELSITSDHLVPNVHEKGVDMRVGLRRMVTPEIGNARMCCGIGSTWNSRAGSIRRTGARGTAGRTSACGAIYSDGTTKGRRLPVREGSGRFILWMSGHDVCDQIDMCRARGRRIRWEPIWTIS